MISILASMSAIARRGSAYKTARLNCEEIGNGHHPFVFVISNHPGQSQEWISEKLSLNKSTVARTLTYLEAKEYITRVPDTVDRRVLLVYPTDKLLSLLPKEREISDEWNEIISDGISQEEMNVFQAVLEKMSIKSKEILGTLQNEEDKK